MDQIGDDGCALQFGTIALRAKSGQLRRIDAVVAQGGVDRPTRRIHELWRDSPGQLEEAILGEALFLRNAELHVSCLSFERLLELLTDLVTAAALPFFDGVIQGGEWRPAGDNRRHAVEAKLIQLGRFGDTGRRVQRPARVVDADLHDLVCRLLLEKKKNTEIDLVALRSVNELMTGRRA